MSSIKQINILLDQDLSEGEQDQLIIKNLGKMIGALLLNLALLIFISWFCLLLFELGMDQFDLSANYNSIGFYAALIFGSFPLFVKFKRNSDYNYWTKLLHEMILDNYALGKYLFKKEVKKRNIERETEYVIVSGLARAGTTAMMNALYSSNEFISIPYSAMPFLLSPNRWRSIYRSKASRSKERAHGDQVKISEQSIEALDEYFFKVELRDSYIHSSEMKEHRIEKGSHDRYLDFQNLYRKEEAPMRYLSKNNNFILRYSSVRELNPSFYMVILFRSPLDQVHSLHKQDVNFRKQQNDDPFVLKYMNWLGHHEFGENTKPFSFEGRDKNEESPGSHSFYLRAWINYYSYVLDLTQDQRLLLVDYEDFLSDPNRLMKKLIHSLNMKSDLEFPHFQPRVEKKQMQNLDQALVNEANKIHAQLKARKLS